MASFLRINKSISIVLCAIYFTCFFKTIGNAYEINIIDTINDAKRIEKLIRKCKKIKKSESLNDAVELMLEVKEESEELTNAKISIDSCIKEIQSELKRNDIKLSKEEWSLYKKFIKTRSKKLNYIYQSVMLGYSVEESYVLFKNVYAGTDFDDDEIELKLPPRVAYGITISLCGGFLYCIPNETVKSAGKGVFLYGISMIVDHYWETKIEEEEKDK